MSLPDPKLNANTIPTDYYQNEPARDSGEFPQDDWGLEDPYAGDPLADGFFLEDSQDGILNGGSGSPSGDFGDAFFADLEGDSAMGVNSELEELKGQMDTLLQQIQNNVNLSQEDKDKFVQEINQLKTQLDLNPDEETLYNIEEQFAQIQDESQELGQHPAAISRMTQSLGMDPEQLEGLLDRYGIDPNSEISLPDSKVENLLNDPAFEELQTLRDELETATEAFDERVSSLRDEATLYMSQGPYGGGNKQPIPDAFEELYKESIGEGMGFEGVKDAANDLAQKTAQILSALTGEDVTAVTGDDEKAGFIHIGSKEFNVVSDLEDPAVDFSTHELEVPEVELVPFIVQVPKGQEVQLPEWMEEADYPVEIIEKPEDFQDKAKKFFGEEIVGPVQKAVTDPVGFAVDSVTKPWEEAYDGIKKVGKGLKKLNHF